ncbi:STAS domain-containing protein [Tuwongella immobilis]|uniref:: STAS_2 n=1 Tax=Tuwongella immobilis TaxID=692036 RepID=A0A6C2YI80_9BACT|nr:STAS domain-containing protein [Tuwongella immobilis]VIP00702.1 : STAS_2 [Tuwongella immobilis]VTR96822.1 : STAS_2 [Tuwongella immobilis]
MSYSAADSVLDVQSDDELLTLTILQASIYDQHTRTLKAAFQDALRDNPTLPIAVSMAHVRYISSEGIGALLSLNRLAREQRRGLRLCDISQQVGEMLKLVRLVDDPSGSDRGLIATSATLSDARVQLRSAKSV